MGTKTVTKIYVTTKNAFGNKALLVAAVPLEHGSAIYVDNNHLDYFKDVYQNYQLPYLSENSIGYYTPDLVYHSGSNHIVEVANYHNWLKTQSVLYEQRQLLDIL